MGNLKIRNEAENKVKLLIAAVYAIEAFVPWWHRKKAKALADTAIDTFQSILDDIYIEEEEV